MKSHITHSLNRSLIFNHSIYLKALMRLFHAANTNSMNYICKSNMHVHTHTHAVGGVWVESHWAPRWVSHHAFEYVWWLCLRNHRWRTILSLCFCFMFDLHCSAIFIHYHTQAGRGNVNKDDGLLAECHSILDSLSHHVTRKHSLFKRWDEYITSFLPFLIFAHIYEKIYHRKKISIEIINSAVCVQVKAHLAIKYMWCCKSLLIRVHLHLVEQRPLKCSRSVFCLSLVSSLAIKN